MYTVTVNKKEGVVTSRVLTTEPRLRDAQAAASEWIDANKGVDRIAFITSSGGYKERFHGYAEQDAIAEV